MSDFIKTPFTFRDEDGNRLVVDRQTDALTFRTSWADGDTGPVVRIPLHSLSVVFSHLIATATADPAQEHPTHA
jgi:hypothetical protein